MLTMQRPINPLSLLPPTLSPSPSPASCQQLGQHLAQLDHLLPDEYVLTMKRHMLDRCPISSYEEVCTIIQQDLGRPPEELFDSFDHTPIASASLGQVHVARGHDGRKLAVKVQHAGLREGAAADIATIQFLVQAVRWVLSGMGMGGQVERVGGLECTVMGGMACTGSSAQKQRWHAATSAPLMTALRPPSMAFAMLPSFPPPSPPASMCSLTATNVRLVGKVRQPHLLSFPHTFPHTTHPSSLYIGMCSLILITCGWWMRLRQACPRSWTLSTRRTMQRRRRPTWHRRARGWAAGGGRAQRLHALLRSA